MRLPFRFISVVSFAALAATTVTASPMDMLEVSGHARTRMQFKDNIGALETNNSEQFINRVRLNLDAVPTKTLKVRVTPQFTNTWGTANAPSDATFTAHEAWMSWMPNSQWGVFVGRQTLAYGRGIIIGENNWANVAQNFDAVRFRFNHQWGMTDVFMARIQEGSTDAGVYTPTANGGDHNLFGIYNALNVGRNMPMVKDLDLYVLFNDNRTAARNRTGTLGARFAGNVQAVDYNLELAGQYGKTGGKTVKGFMTDAELGTKLMDRNRVALGFGYGNSEWAEVAPEGHRALGFADMFNTRNNLINIAVLTKWEINRMWSATVDGHYFMAAKDDFGSASGLATKSGNRPLAMEGDLALHYMPEEHLAFLFGYNIVKTLSALNSSALVVRRNKTYNEVHLQGTLSF